jgi:murein DD-endopeptidase MepM/ murein hydrolase activator NlpD
MIRKENLESSRLSTGASLTFPPASPIFTLYSRKRIFVLLGLKARLIKTWLKIIFGGGLFKNDKVGFFAIMALSFLLIIFKGSSEGQRSIFGNVLSGYIEETAVSAAINPSRNELADINSVVANPGYGGVLKSSTLSTIQDNSIVSRGTILTDILDEFTGRGSQVSTYTVQEGDTLSFIASDYGVSINTVIWANNLKNADDINPGMELKIPPVTGVIHKVKKGDTIAALAKKYGVEADKIISFNFLPQEGDLQEGQELIIPGGKLQTQTAPAPVSTAKRFAYLPNLGGFFMIPAIGFNWGRVHGRNGVDIANSCGTPIYAAADGFVTLAKSSGWNGGFGKFLRITHSNGTETLYAHLGGLLASVGEYIAKGQEIGLMGTTGRSTGCHLHFEVHGAKNPLAKY